MACCRCITAWIIFFSSSVKWERSGCGGAEGFREVRPAMLLEFSEIGSVSDVPQPTLQNEESAQNFVNYNLKKCLTLPASRTVAGFYSLSTGMLKAWDNSQKPQHTQRKPTCSSFYLQIYIRCYAWLRTIVNPRQSSWCFSDNSRLCRRRSCLVWTRLIYEIPACVQQVAY